LGKNEIVKGRAGKTEKGSRYKKRRGE